MYLKLRDATIASGKPLGRYAHIVQACDTLMRGRLGSGQAPGPSFTKHGHGRSVAMPDRSRKFKLTHYRNLCCPSMAHARNTFESRRFSVAFHLVSIVDRLICVVQIVLAAIERIAVTVINSSRVLPLWI